MSDERDALEAFRRIVSRQALFAPGYPIGWAERSLVDLAETPEPATR